MTSAAGGERSRLVRALALSRRFHLYLARCASPRAADHLVAELSAELPQLGRAGVRLVRLDPYSGRPEDTPLTDGELADRVLLPLLDPPEELRGAIQLVDASRAAYADTDAWARFFSLWNEKRNVLGPSHGEVVVMLPAALAPVFAAAAPDVWSIRSGEYVIDEDASARGAVLEVRETALMYTEEATAAAASLTLGTSGRAGSRLDDALLLLRATPPLALFGGDLVVRPWVEDLLSAVDASEITEPPDQQGGLSLDAPSSLVAQRELRLAWWRLAQRRFDAADKLFSEVLQRAGDGDVELMADALSGVGISLAAQGHADAAAVQAGCALALIGVTPGEEGPDGRLSPGVTARVLRANALAQWCLGHLEQTEQLDRRLSVLIGPSNERDLSRVLRLAERGELDTARGEASHLLRPERGPERLRSDHGARYETMRFLREPVARMVATDLELLAGDLDAALRHLERASGEARTSGFWPKEHASLARRCDVAMALVEVARGNEQRAARLLAGARDVQVPSSRGIEPDGGFRADAFRAVVSGILAMATGAPEDTSTWCELARDFIDAWGRSGLDFRSCMRARIAVELLWTMVQSEDGRAVASARDIAGRAEALLGDTAEDLMSRALAVEAHRELARRIASAGAGDARAAAQRAAALAQPLGNLGVPAWEELVRAAELGR
ncbi:hypothetical protein AB3662_16420 [Sorangium cellulosum]|uniref:hypothetical protein n=1 Tax=Sorangium cellulosum TaxID=56 RepID=UPI003D9A73B6